MKNFLFLGLMGSAALFSSCSSEDTNTPEQKLLLHKITTVYYDNPTQPETVVQTLEYNNQGELIKTHSGERATTFEYNNGKPVKANYYNAAQELEYYTVFSYTGDLLTGIKAVYTNPNLNRTSKYTYNSNGQLTSSTLCQTEDCSHPDTVSYTYNGDNISTETSVIGGTISYSYKSDFSYDDRPNPYTHINRYLKIMMERAYTLSKNNYTTDRVSFKNSDGSWNQSQTTTYSIQYNNAGFPVQVTGKEANGSPSVQYSYEYIVQ